MKKRIILIGLFALVLLAVMIPAVSSASCSHPASAQQWVVIKDATCTTAGTKHYKCTACGQLLATANISARGHSWGVWYDVVKATCQKKGTQAHNCRNCGTTKQRTVDYNYSNHQDFGEWKTVGKSCNGGYKERKCKCGHAEREYLTKTAHSWGVWYDVVKATCQSKGTQAHNCRNCGTTEERTVEYDYSNHQDYGDWYEVDKPCNGGYRERKCACGNAEREYYTDTAHTPSGGRYPIKVDEKEYYWVVNCSVCDGYAEKTPARREDYDRYVIGQQYPAILYEFARANYPEKVNEPFGTFATLMFNYDKGYDMFGSEVNKFIDEHSENENDRRFWGDCMGLYYQFKTGPYTEEDDYSLDVLAH